MIALLKHTRSLLLIIALVCMYTLTSAQCDVLVWSDEFEGTGPPDPANWGYDIGAGGWGNGEVQRYTSNLTNVKQENGKLIITAIKSGGEWTSGRIKTQNKMSFTYGKLVFRAKLPVGGGTWPALWMLGQSISTGVGWPDCGEIDVMEHVGNNTTRVQSALHTRSSFGNTQNVGATTVGTAESAFHDYAVSWNANRIQFSVDGVVYYTYNPANKTVQNYPFTADQFIIMNIAMGGALGGTINSSLTSASMEVEYVRLYEERQSPAITGPQFVYENQSNVQFTAPEYENGVTYDWVPPVGAEIVSGQGTKDVTIDWGNTDGTLQLNLSGNTGCTNNSTELNVTTIVEPTGDRYLAHSFATNSVAGWTKTGTSDVTMQASDGKLNITYSSTEVRYIQYELPKAVDVQNYTILKLPITIPTSSTSVPQLVIKLLDGNGNETDISRYELNVAAKDGATRLYSKNFVNQWTLEDPDVDPNRMKYIRIYIIPGKGSFSVGDVYFYKNQPAPAQPTGLTAQTTANQEIILAWSDISNATSFHLYRSDSEDGPFTRVQSNIRTSENPLLIVPTKALSYYTVSGVNAAGESVQSTPVEAIAQITGTENPLSEVSIYPNPSAGKFRIKLNEQIIDKISIHDLNGREMSFQHQTSNEFITVDITAQRGIYFLQLIRKNKSRVYKLLIE